MDYNLNKKGKCDTIFFSNWQKKSLGDDAIRRVLLPSSVKYKYLMSEIHRHSRSTNSE